jgi:Ras family protein T1
MQVQHVVPEVTIPPEVTPENVTTCIIDSSCTSTSLEGIRTVLERLAYRLQLFVDL